jgi:hypothetical protein
VIHKRGLAAAVGPVRGKAHIPRNRAVAYVVGRNDATTVVAGGAIQIESFGVVVFETLQSVAWACLGVGEHGRHVVDVRQNLLAQRVHLLGIKHAGEDAETILSELA